MDKIIEIALKLWVWFGGKKTLTGYLIGHAAILSDPILRQKFIDLISNPTKESAILFLGYGFLSIGVIDRLQKQIKAWIDSKGLNV